LFLVGGVAAVGAFLLEIVGGYQDLLVGTTSLTWENLQNKYEMRRKPTACRGDAEFRRFHRVMGSNCSLLPTMCAPRKEAGLLIPPVLGLCDLPGLWGKSQPPRSIVGLIWMLAESPLASGKDVRIRREMSFELPPED